MSRPDITLEMREAIFAPETDDEYLILLTLDHGTMSEPIRVHSGVHQLESRGHAFVPFPFDLHLPDDSDGRGWKARLSIDNVDRQIVQSIRSLSSSPTLLIEIVRAAAPDIVEASWSDFKLVNVTYDAKTVQGDLTIEDFMSEPWPQGIFSPSNFPGLF